MLDEVVVRGGLATAAAAPIVAIAVVVAPPAATAARLRQRSQNGWAKPPTLKASLPPSAAAVGNSTIGRTSCFPVSKPGP
jgi:hypothetical protein